MVWDHRLDRALADLNAHVDSRMGEYRRRLEDILRDGNPGNTAGGTLVAERALAPWDSPLWSDSSPTTSQAGFGAAVRCGELSWPTRDGGSSRLPCVLPLIGRNNLVFEGSGHALDAGNSVLESVVFRLVTSGLPGKVRLTVLDPRGLGQSFARCLMLPEKVRGAKFWHETSEIQAQLAELTSHMAMVIQKYLQSRYESIDAYNADAGQVQEPYRVLLVANFPSGFDQRAAERLLSIASNGPRVGVHVLISVDTNQPLPRGVDLDVLRRSALVLRGTSQGVRLELGSAFDGVPPVVLPDAAPPQALAQAIAEAVTKGAARFDRIEVPFDKVCVPERSDTWPSGSDSSNGVVVPVGQYGANEHQDLRLFSNETAPHVLIAGQTGSGKTVLLHVIILALAYHYPPDELQFYLIDFKEGVEFKPYAGLPHSRVVAVQSEPEFGLSVLEGTYSEMVRRGDTFRETGARSIADWRRITGRKLPRLVVIIDEFQVLIANSRRAAQIVADIARRGRAFGVHLILASQSISDSGLEPATLAQMAIRIALRMSQRDSALVLHADNIEACYLERPGEAIFNNRNGQPGHNNRFQVAYISPSQVDSHIDALRHREITGHRPETIIFDGHRPASVDRNTSLLESIRRRSVAVPAGYDIHLGEPVTLRQGHVSCRLRRQGRGNFLICGGPEPVALRVVAVGLVSLIAALPEGRAQVRLVDLTNRDSPLFGQLKRLMALEPNGTKYATRSGIEPQLAEVYDELLSRRDSTEDPEDFGSLRAPWFVVIFGAHRATALRGRSTARKQFDEIVKDGADVGIHLLIWADTEESLSRGLGVTKYCSVKVALQGGGSGRIFSSSSSDLPSHPPNYLLYACDDEPGVGKARLYGTSAMDKLLEYWSRP